MPECLDTCETCRWIMYTGFDYRKHHQSFHQEAPDEIRKVIGNWLIICLQQSLQTCLRLIIQGLYFVV